MLAWDHNAYYHRLLLREVPVGATRVLDIGCGAGRLASELAARAAHVDAVDRDPGMIALARRRVPVNVECRVVTEPQRLCDDRRYQLPVTMVCPEFSPDDARSRVAAGAAPVAELARIGAVHWVDLDSGHWPQVSCPDRLAEVVLDAAERAHRD